MEVGAQMKADTAGAHWQIKMQESAALIGAILSIIHPQLFHQGIDTSVTHFRVPMRLSNSWN